MAWRRGQEEAGGGTAAAAGVLGGTPPGIGGDGAHGLGRGLAWELGRPSRRSEFFFVFLIKRFLRQIKTE